MVGFCRKQISIPLVLVLVLVSRGATHRHTRPGSDARQTVEQVSGLVQSLSKTRESTLLLAAGTATTTNTKGNANDIATTAKGNATLSPTLRLLPLIASPFIVDQAKVSHQASTQLTPRFDQTKTMFFNSNQTSVDFAPGSKSITREKLTI